jgi:hypothetical protein
VTLRKVARWSAPKLDAENILIQMFFWIFHSITFP